MAYFIFLKSLRSLEEFRKNPHVKMTPKSPSTNFQSLGQFKNLIFNSEIPFSLFSAQPPPLFFSSPAVAHLLPPCLASRLVACSACPIRPLVRFGRRLLRLSDSAARPFRPSPAPLVDSAVASLSLIGGPTLSVSPGSSPSSDNTRARPRCHRSPATEHRPAPHLGCDRTVTTSPSFSLP
jgi:hypothetical protein